jgi:hypothetical protein
MLHRSNRTVRELARVRNIKNAEQASMDDISRSITLAFNSNGQKLIFIDHRVRFPK